MMTFFNGKTLSSCHGNKQVAVYSAFTKLKFHQTQQNTHETKTLKAQGIMMTFFNDKTLSSS
jgi:hypothetical protein